MVSSKLSNALYRLWLDRTGAKLNRDPPPHQGVPILPACSWALVDIGLCGHAGVHAPVVYQVDLARRRIVMQDLPECATMREAICRLSAAEGASCAPLLALAARLGRLLATLHAAGLVHGDLTTSNLLVDDALENITVIDFGLSVADGGAEELAVDLYVLERAVLSTHPRSAPFTERLYRAYEQTWGGGRAVLDKLDQVRMRGRKRLMLG